MFEASNGYDATTSVSLYGVLGKSVLQSDLNVAAADPGVDYCSEEQVVRDEPHGGDPHVYRIHGTFESTIGKVVDGLHICQCVVSFGVKCTVGFGRNAIVIMSVSQFGTVEGSAELQDTAVDSAAGHLGVGKNSKCINSSVVEVS